MIGEGIITAAELEDYARRYGKAAAASLLLLTPPEWFDGDYEEALAKYAGKQ